MPNPMMTQTKMPAVSININTKYLSLQQFFKHKINTILCLPIGFNIFAKTLATLGRKRRITNPICKELK